MPCTNQRGIMVTNLRQFNPQLSWTVLICAITAVNKMPYIYTNKRGIMVTDLRQFNMCQINPVSVELPIRIYSVNPDLAMHDSSSCVDQTRTLLLLLSLLFQSSGGSSTYH